MWIRWIQIRIRIRKTGYDEMSQTKAIAGMDHAVQKGLHHLDNDKFISFHSLIFV
jgi:hypothetical protein